VLLVIDNYDSFTFNLVQAVGAIAPTLEMRVVRNDRITTGEAEALSPQALLLSPGPCGPAETGVSIELIRRFAGRIPILGVCLGHQLLVQLHGGTVGAALELVHGKAGEVERVAPDPLLDGLEPRFRAGRYHSLAAHQPIPDAFVVTARTDDGTVMAVRHRDAPTHGVQFHPESVLTPDGPRILAAFLTLGGPA
jgi:anthranilate synthase/aminodeoxychorismate synthase-like glutamine amidotransferase